MTSNKNFILCNCDKMKFRASLMEINPRYISGVVPSARVHLLIRSFKDDFAALELIPPSRDMPHFSRTDHRDDCPISPFR
jgi:hypothetical protein